MLTIMSRFVSETVQTVDRVLQCSTDALVCKVVNKFQEILDPKTAVWLGALTVNCSVSLPTVLTVQIVYQKSPDHVPLVVALTTALFVASTFYTCCAASKAYQTLHPVSGQ